MRRVIILLVVAGVAAATGSSAQTSRSLTGTPTGSLRLPLRTEGVGIAGQDRGRGLSSGSRRNIAQRTVPVRPPAGASASGCPAGLHRSSSMAGSARRRSSGPSARGRCVAPSDCTEGGCPTGAPLGGQVRRRAGDRRAGHAVLPVDRSGARLRRADAVYPLRRGTYEIGATLGTRPPLIGTGRSRSFDAGLAACGRSRSARDALAATAGGSAPPEVCEVPGLRAR